MTPKELSGSNGRFLHLLTRLVRGPKVLIVWGKNYETVRDVFLTQGRALGLVAPAELPEVPMEPTLANAQDALARYRRCFFCGALDSYVQGPRGGEATNVMCVVCGQRLNYLPELGMVIEIQEPHPATRAKYNENPADKSPRTDRFHFWYEDAEPQ